MRMTVQTTENNNLDPLAGSFDQASISHIPALGFYTLLKKEVLRFLKVPLQTVFAPMMTTLLFLAVFTLAFGEGGRYDGNVAFSTFLAPGLIMMSVIQNAFANTSSSLVISKVQGNIVDILMPPLSPLELTCAYALSGLIRGLVVAMAVATCMYFFIDLSVYSWVPVLFFLVGAGLMLGMLGTIGGIISDKFDHIAAVTNFVIMPLSFLSGTFYSVERLTGVWYDISHINPFFYMIDGFRYGFIGTADSSQITGAIVVITLNLVLFGVVWFLFSRGYKLKA